MQQENSIIDLRRFWRVAKQWRWILIALTVILTAAGTWFGFSRLSNYEITGEVLIGDNSSDSDSQAGGLQQMMRTFSVGGFAGTGVNNELQIIGSYDVMLRTVKSLDLNRTYIGKDSDGAKVQLWKDTPVRIEAPAEQFDSLQTAFTIKIIKKENGKINIEATKGIFKKTIAKAEDVALPYMLSTPYGDYRIIATDSFGSTPYKTLDIMISGSSLVAKKLTKQAKIGIPDKLADIIQVDYTANNANLGKAIVDGIFGEYNAKRRERLHESSRNSIQYYDERIAETFEALQKSEKEVRDYQKNNELMGLDSELGLLVSDAYGSRQEIRSTHYNIAYYETVLDILRNRLNDDVIIPSIETLGDPNVEAFNGAIQARRDLRLSATDDNEAMIRLNERIEGLRDIIIENATKSLAKAKKDLLHKESLAATAEGRLENFPEYQLDLINLTRDKEHLNQLYLYLVGQRENAVLQLYSTANIGFVFQPAYVVKEGGILKKLIWPLGALIFSLFCCVCWCLLMMWCSRKVKDTMDLAPLGIEANSITYDGSSQQPLHILRNRLTANPDCRVIYFGALNDTDTMRQKFADTLLSIGRSVEILTGFNDNDAILTPETQNQISTLLQSTDYVIVSIPDTHKVADLENAVDAPTAALLLSLRSGRLTRQNLKQILKGQTADKVFTILCK